MFSISFSKPDRFLNEGDLLIGEININGDVEGFAADLSIWTKNDYILHWDSSIQRAMLNGKFSILCCSRGLHSSNLWVFVPVGTIIKLYNSIILNNDITFIGTEIDSVNHESFFRGLNDGEASEWQFNRL